MAIAANTNVRPEKMRAWINPTNNSSPYTPTVATNGTKKADTKGPTRRKVSVLEQNAMVRAIQNQLRRCWRIDPGARGAEDIGGLTAVRFLGRQGGEQHTDAHR